MPGVLASAGAAASPGSGVPTGSDRPQRVGPSSRLVARLVAFALACSGAGALAGVLWWWVVDLATYTLAASGRATTTERGLTRFFAGDAWFCVIGIMLGVGFGLLGWRLFRAAGWVLVPVVTLGALGAALACWAVGFQLGPGDFVARLAAAAPGDVVPIELTLRAWVSLMTWPFAAVVPVLLGASLGRDDEEPRPIRPPRLASAGGESGDGGSVGRGDGD